MLGVVTHGIDLGYSLAMIGTFNPTIVRVVVNVYTMCEAQTLSLSSGFSHKIWGVPLWT